MRRDNLTPNEKAVELVDRFCNSYSTIWTHMAIDLSLIAVNELIRCLPSVSSRQLNHQEINEYCSEYWEQVKKHINEL